MKKVTALLLCIIMVLSLMGCTGSQRKDSYTAIPGLDTKQSATLKIAIPYETNKALNTVSNAFMEKYPNVSIELQYVEDYDKNAIQLFKDSELDMILQKDIHYTEYTIKNEDSEEEVPDGTNTADFFYNFADDTEIDFSQTAPEITNNYRHTRQDESGNEITYQYCYPLGGETRGVFVNTSLLDQYDLKVPTNYEDLLACCETLKQNGLIPIQGCGDTAAYGLGLAASANKAVHDETLLNAMKNAEPGVSAEFEDILNKIYTLATKRYYDYKAVEEMGYFLSSSEIAQMQSFLGLQTDPDTLEITKPENNIGYAAFIPYLSSSQTVIQTLIDEYDLATEYTFIPSPLNDKGTNSPVYITPYYGICANKNSDNLIWIREFVNFLFQEENNKIYAENASIIPNTTDALAYTAEKYQVDIDKDVTLCGQILFSDDYNGFNPLSSGLKNTLKCSAQKYMINLNKDNNGNIQFETDENGTEFLYLGNEETQITKEYIGEEDSTKPGYAFCTLQYYIDGLESEFEKYRTE